MGISIRQFFLLSLQIQFLAIRTAIPIWTYRHFCSNLLFSKLYKSNSFQSGLHTCTDNSVRLVYFLTLEIVFKADFLILFQVAKDGNDQNEISLLDSRGCPSEGQIMGPLLKSPDGKFRCNFLTQKYFSLDFLSNDTRLNLVSEDRCLQYSNLYENIMFIVDQNFNQGK